MSTFEQAEASLDRLVETALKVKQQRDDLLAAAKCAANVLWLLEEQVSLLGLHAANVRVLLNEAIVKAEVQL